MNGSSSKVEDQVLLRDNWIKTIVLRSGRFCVEHYVSHSGILVPQKVAQHIYRPLVEISIAIIWVTALFMSVNCPVHEVDYFVFNFYNADSLRVKVEGHVLVTSNVHESTVNSE